MVIIINNVASCGSASPASLYKIYSGLVQKRPVSHFASKWIKDGLFRRQGRDVKKNKKARM